MGFEMKEGEGEKEALIPVVERTVHTSFILPGKGGRNAKRRSSSPLVSKMRESNRTIERMGRGSS